MLRLANGVTNAIGPALVAELAQALAAMGDGCRAMVLAGGEKFFSMGFDLPELLTLDRAGMGEFFEHFNQVCLDLCRHKGQSGRGGRGRLPAAFS